MKILPTSLNMEVSTKAHDFKEPRNLRRLLKTLKMLQGATLMTGFGDLVLVVTQQER